MSVEHHGLAAGALRLAPGGSPALESADAPRILAPASGLVRTLPPGGGIIAVPIAVRRATTCSADVIATGGVTVTPSHRTGCAGDDDLVVGANSRHAPARVVLVISARRGAWRSVRRVLVRVAAAPSTRAVTSFRGTLSANWSGYLAPGATTVTDAAADFTVPAVDCTTAPRGAGVSFWVGTGGSGGGQPLLQTGITETCDRAAPQLRAWWEEVPSHPDQAHFFARFPVRVRDQLHAEVFRGPGGRWETLLVDQRTGRRAVMVTGEGWGVAASSAAPVLLQHRGAPAGFAGATSAEWITEDYADAGAASLVPLLDFGSVAFSHVRADPAIQLAAGDAVAIEQSGRLRARPSALSGDRFFVRALRRSSVT
ncbi:MAG: G1 family endopeptidase [Actinomycetota bacterium]|nr:G1 family endopeptidase [Actinomycetota bacterium]